MERTDRDLLYDMLYRINNIMEYTAGLVYGAFEGDRMAQDAVIWNILALAQSANEISEEIKDKYAIIDWQNIIDNAVDLGQNYYRINLDKIWNFIKEDAPNYKTLLEEIIQIEGW